MRQLLRRLAFWRLLRRSSMGTREARRNERVGKKLVRRREREFPLCEDRSEYERLWIEP